MTWKTCSRQNYLLCCRQNLCNLSSSSPSLGYGNLARPDNIGSMEMEGFEALFRASPQKKDLNVDMSLSYTMIIPLKKWGTQYLIILDLLRLGKVTQNIPYGVKKSMAQRLTLLILLLGLEGSVPFLDPVNGYS